MSEKTRAGFTAKYYSDSPSIRDEDGTLHWVTRGANFIVVATQARAGACLQRNADVQPDEYMLLLPPNVAARISSNGETVGTQGDSLTIVPPGESEVTFLEEGWAYRIFTKRASDLIPHAANANVYEAGNAGAAELVSWPEPAGGYRIRHYPLPEYANPKHPMRLFRTRDLMVNVFLPSTAPRDVSKMTPHLHDDFEQGSLTLAGDFIHHLRYPWVPDMNTWREDGHEEVQSPSLIVIPPKVIHTTQSLGSSGMRLVDIFSPPREDFSLKSGLVCNEAEYPLPEHLESVPASAATV